MSQETFLRARLELELREAREELTRLRAERRRLARKNEMLSAVMYELRGAHALPELALGKIEDALAFDGQPWDELRALEDDDEEEELADDEPTDDEEPARPVEARPGAREREE